MKIFIFLAAMLIGSPAAFAAVFEWVDDAGVINFTDKPENIPQKYRKRAREKTLPEEQKVSPMSELRQTETAGPGGSSAKIYGGHGQAWWQGKFQVLRNEIKVIEETLPAKRKELEDLHRKRLVFQKARDRSAYYKLKSEIEKDEERLNELRKQISKLEEEASLAGVPMEWRK